MGFDLYGLNPTTPKGFIKPEIDWSDKPSDKERDDFFTDLNDYEDKVPGHYFRNNVWYWRPLWQFVMSSCDDILTDEDCEEGSSNGGHEISEDKALAIADKIDELEIIKDTNNAPDSLNSTNNNFSSLFDIKKRLV